MDGEESVGGVGQDGECLLCEEDDPQHKGDDEERDDAAAAPRPNHATEVDGDDQAGEGCDAEDGAHPVDLSEALAVRHRAGRVEWGQEEEVDGREDAAND